MSRAFVKEDQTEPGADLVPDRVLSDLPNYVTRRGLEALSRQVEELREARHKAETISDDEERRAALLRIDRDLRYTQARLDTAELVDPRGLPPDEVHFGSEVTVADEGGAERTYTIVGEDEADLSKGLLSFAAPLARSLMRARVGDVVIWKRPAGDRELEVRRIRNA
jgi:transcription elongation factor GreB